MTLAQHVRAKQDGIIGDAENAQHCEGASCLPGAWSVCACPCVACKVRRHALTLAQRLYGLPLVRLPGEKPEAWALRRAMMEDELAAGGVVRAL